MLLFYVIDASDDSTGFPVVFSYIIVEFLLFTDLEDGYPYVTFQLVSPLFIYLIYQPEKYVISCNF